MRRSKRHVERGKLVFIDCALQFEITQSRETIMEMRKNLSRYINFSHN